MSVDHLLLMTAGSVALTVFSIAVLEGRGLILKTNVDGYFTLSVVAIVIWYSPTINADIFGFRGISGLVCAAILSLFTFVLLPVMASCLLALFALWLLGRKRTTRV